MRSPVCGGDAAAGKPVVSGVAALLAASGIVPSNVSGSTDWESSTRLSSVFIDSATGMAISVEEELADAGSDAE